MKFGVLLLNIILSDFYLKLNIFLWSIEFIFENDNNLKENEVLYVNNVLLYL